MSEMLLLGAGASMEADVPIAPAFRARDIDDAVKNTAKKRTEALVTKRSPSLSSSDNAGDAVERFIKEWVGKWQARLKSPAMSSDADIEWEIEKQIKSSSNSLIIPDNA